VHSFEISAVRERLKEAGGGYEVVHESAGLAIGVYVLVAPEADRQQPHEDDEVYVVLEGNGVLQVETRKCRSERVLPCSWRPAPSTGSPRTRT
jgi:mannose-6-phosphate isomerase-like protein (cupin superfamily)